MNREIVYNKCNRCGHIQKAKIGIEDKYSEYNVCNRCGYVNKMIKVKAMEIAISAG